MVLLKASSHGAAEGFSSAVANNLSIQVTVEFLWDVFVGVGGIVHQPLHLGTCHSNPERPQPLQTVSNLPPPQHSIS